MQIDQKKARIWSRMGVRACYGMAMMEAVKRSANVLALSADLGRSSGMKQLMEQHPERFVNCGIAEQNMVGVAAGLASEGYNVFASSFAPFISMRASEQVRMNLGYMNLPVKLVALGSGVGMGFLGNSHFGLEDVSVMRAIPGLTVVCPADCVEVFKVIDACVDYDKPVYIRLTGGVNNPVVNQEDYDFQIGRSIELRRGRNVALLATGSMVAHALKVADRLEEEHSVRPTVINMHTIKPLDVQTLEGIYSNHGHVFTIEEHTVVGGLGSAVAEWAADKDHRVRHHLIGIEDCYVETGSYEYSLNAAGLSMNRLYERITAML